MYLYRKTIISWQQETLNSLPNKFGAGVVVDPNRPVAPVVGVENKLGVEVGVPNRLGFVVAPNRLVCWGAPKVGAEVAAPKVDPNISE